MRSFIDCGQHVSFILDLPKVGVQPRGLGLPLRLLDSAPHTRAYNAILPEDFRVFFPDDMILWKRTRNCRDDQRLHTKVGDYFFFFFIQFVSYLLVSGEGGGEV